MDDALTWHTQEHTARTRQPDWYWILGIIAVALAITSILFGNILFAVVIVTGAFAIGFASVSTQNVYKVSITKRGILIDNTLFPYDNILSFCIFDNEDEPATLSLRTKSIFAPQLSIPIVGIDPYEVYETLTFFIEEEVHEEGIFDRLVDFLGF